VFKSSINPITNPNPVYRHSLGRQYDTQSPSSSISIYTYKNFNFIKNPEIQRVQYRNSPFHSVLSFPILFTTPEPTYLRSILVTYSKCCLLLPCRNFQLVSRDSILHLFLIILQNSYSPSALWDRVRHNLWKKFLRKCLNFPPACEYRRIRGREVSIATGYRLDGRGFRVRVSEIARFFSSPRRPDRLWNPPSQLLR
jgi:hypothetical protein